MGASFRLRRRLGRHEAVVEAVLEPSGKVQDATGVAAEKTALEALKEAVRAIERVRARRRVEEGEMLSAWTPMQRARWTLVDTFESDGRRYMLARENAPSTLGPEALTARERQVVGFAALGHSSKLIAYELGIAYSTLGVLLARAAAKLGARSRAELSRALRAVPVRGGI
jgi:DNA-binding CsgD family transcriptional regulator